MAMLRPWLRFQCRASWDRSAVSAARPSLSSASNAFSTRSVPAAEERDELFGGRESPGAGAQHGPGIGGRRAEQAVQMLFGAPQQRRCDAGRGGHVPGDDIKHLADEPIGGPRRKADGTAWASGPDDLVRGALMIGCEHRPEDAQYRVV